MHILQLQQMAAIKALSLKLDLALERMGLTPDQVKELSAIEDKLQQLGTDQQLADWRKYLEILIDPADLDRIIKNPTT